MVGMVPVRQSADVRRASILRAAIVEFARSGYAGTSTEAIAARAGISQPYIFRLFGTKKDLFIATYDVVSGGHRGRVRRGRRGLKVRTPWPPWGWPTSSCCKTPICSRCNSTVSPPRQPTRTSPGPARRRSAACGIWSRVRRRDARDMREFFAQGMLCSVIAAIDLRSVAEPWAQSFFDEVAEEEKRLALRKMGRGVDPVGAAAAGDAVATASGDSRMHESASARSSPLFCHL